jgi:hypothetical protein
MELYVVLLA